ncbi:DedA family protein [Gorillibacterium timonense]|uniref:DedA family protein n=1 Tax=Gorillibacterium timonense TaxID=1689269 RepID=UPI00071DDD6D|nr:DedA family protein [Gorillibacterium timonense]
MNFAYVEKLFEIYGYGVLFAGLFLEFIALPFPGETTLTYSGYLSYKGILHLAPVIGIGFIGTSLGMTLTYWIGRSAGMPFLNKYGKWILLTPAKLLKTRRWFLRYGPKLLFIGYFIPGVRHFTGYLSGIMGIPFRTFILYTYLGALFWVASFAFLGFGFGPRWESVFHLIELHGWKVFVVLGTLGLLVVVYRMLRMKRAGGSA